MEGSELTEMAELREAGALGFSDDGLPIRSARVLRRALQYQRLAGGVIALHEEDPELSGDGGVMHEGAVSAALGLAGIPSVSESTMIARDAALAAYEDAPRSTSSTSRRASRWRRSPRQGGGRRDHLRGDPAPPDASPTRRSAASTPRFKMNPPLRTEDDRQALIEGLRDGRHRLHRHRPRPAPADEKEVPFEQAAMGVTGLETAFAALYTELVLPGVLELGAVVERMGAGASPFGIEPSRIARARGQPRPGRSRGRVDGGRRRLGEPLAQLLLRRAPLRAAC